MPIDPKSLPQDPVILQRMLVDLTAQLDKTQKLLRQLLEAKHHTKSEQWSADQLQLFIEELQRSKAASKDDDELPPPDAGSGKMEAEEAPRPRGRQPMSSRRRRVAPARAKAKKAVVPGGWRRISSVNASSTIWPRKKSTAPTASRTCTCSAKRPASATNTFPRSSL